MGVPDPTQIKQNGPTDRQKSKERERAPLCNNGFWMSARPVFLRPNASSGGPRPIFIPSGWQKRRRARERGWIQRPTPQPADAAHRLYAVPCPAMPAPTFPKLQSVRGVDYFVVSSAGCPARTQNKRGKQEREIREGNNCLP